MPTVRQATRSDVPELSAALARAFVDDPVTTFIFPSDRLDDRLRRHFDIHLRHVSLRHGATYTTDKHEGGAIWMPPGRWELSPMEILRTMPGYTKALGKRLLFGLRALLEIEKRHPKTPHYYLATLGTDPAHQGKGVGSALLKPVLDRCDAEGIPAYLESSKEQNVPFYARHGFTVTEEMTMSNGGPRLWLMWRKPREPDSGR